MPDTQSSVGGNFSLISSKLRSVLCLPLLLLLTTYPTSNAQVAPSGSATSWSYPVQFFKFNPNGVSAKVHNVGNKVIVGLVFNAALADAAEYWKWLHWDFDDHRPLRNFGWNKPVKVARSKTS